jgi:hypothetical protein
MTTFNRGFPHAYLGSSMAHMESHGDPPPSTPFYKDNGKWTFFTYPNGKEEEAGQYSSRNLAIRGALFAHQMWEANGRSYGPLKVRLRRET